MQILDEERGDDHPHPVVHEAGVQQLTHPGIDDRESGAALLPGVEQRLRLGSGVHFDTVESGVPVVPPAARPLRQHAGVEIAERQLPQIGRRARLTDVEIGRQCPGVDGAELQMRRHATGARLVRAVASGGVVADSLGEELLPGGQRRRFTGRKFECHIGIRGITAIRQAGHRARVDPVDLRGITLRRCAPADFAPAVEERGEHLVCAAVVLGDPPRRNQIGRTGRNEFRTAGAQCGCDSTVAADPERTEIRGDVHAARAGRRAHRRDHLFGAPPGDQQPAAQSL